MRGRRSEIILSQREKGLHKRTGPIISSPPGTTSNENNKKKKKEKGKKKGSNYTTQKITATAATKYQVQVKSNFNLDLNAP